MRLGSLGWHQLRRALNARSWSWQGKGGEQDVSLHVTKHL